MTFRHSTHLGCVEQLVPDLLSNTQVGLDVPNLVFEIVNDCLQLNNLQGMEDTSSLSMQASGSITDQHLRDDSISSTRVPGGNSIMKY